MKMFSLNLFCNDNTFVKKHRIIDIVEEKFMDKYRIYVYFH